MKNQTSPLLQLTQKAGFSSFLSSLLAIACGLLVGFVILLISDPFNAFGGFLSILVGALSDLKSVGQVLYMATPIILTGLSVGFANKTGLFNIGGAGQFIVGAYAAVLVGVKCTFIPGALLWVCCLLASMCAGALWGLVPGILKALCNVNEVIACIMMNYIGMYGVNFLITLTMFDSLKNQSMTVAPHANAPKLGMDQIFRHGSSASSVNAGIFIAILAGIFIYFLIEKTKFGYELKACGYNRDAAKYAGINEKRSIILSMVIAGALAGLGGACLYLAGAGKGIEVVDVLAAEGFNGIPVALLGLNNPIGIIFAGIFVAY
ncbi:MAG: ABC transporter permease, partial [Ruthenibacterium sp.]